MGTRTPSSRMEATNSSVRSPLRRMLPVISRARGSRWTSSLRPSKVSAGAVAALIGSGCCAATRVGAVLVRLGMSGDQASQQQQAARREHCDRPAEAISRSSHDTNQDSSSVSSKPHPRTRLSSRVHCHSRVNYPLSNNRAISTGEYGGFVNLADLPSTADNQARVASIRSRQGPDRLQDRLDRGMRPDRKIVDVGPPPGWSSSDGNRETAGPCRRTSSVHQRCPRLDDRQTSGDARRICP